MPAGPSALVPWHVTVEMSGDVRDQALDALAVESLVDVLIDYRPMISHLPRKWTVRLTIWSETPLAAGEEGIEVVTKAAAEASLPSWPVSRIEVARQ
ncbi:MAG: hypothetical protein R3249_05060 [Nitriliruptorales bacterium]|nr:hypothetical protein [Nitriliruptorales bacterium]